MLHRASTLAVLVAIVQLVGCRSENPIAPQRLAPLPGPSVPALSSLTSATAAIAEVGGATSSDPDVVALNGVTTPVRWYYVYEPTTRRWFIVERSYGSVLMLDGVDQSTSFGIYWRPVNRFSAASSPSTQRYQDAGDNLSVTFSADGRTVSFGAASTPSPDQFVRALAGTTQTVQWFYIYIDPTLRWYIVAPAGREVLMLHRVDRSTSFGIYWKPINNVTAAGSPTTSSFADAGDNYPGLTIAPDGQSISFGVMGGAATPGPTGTNSTTGSLQLTVSGLPSSLPGSISITGPQGYSRTVSSTATLGSLVPGTYVISAASVVGNIRYSATPTSHQVNVGGGSTVSSTVSYAPARTFELNGNARLSDGTTTPVFIDQRNPNGVTIDPGKRTWVVIHGRLNGPADLGAVADSIAAATRTSGAADQILMLSWEVAARETRCCWGAFSEGEQWIQPVGEWAATVLKEYGFSTSNLNVVGHSWGAYVGDELASAFGGVNVLVALDPAANTNGSQYNPNDQGTIHFGAHSQFALAFHSSSMLGNEVTPGTADEAFSVGFFQTIGVVTQLDRHRWIKDLFAALVTGTGPVSQRFTLQRLLSNQSGPWQRNKYQSDDAYGQIVPLQKRYEGVLAARTSDHGPATLLYYDNAGVEQTVRETAAPSTQLSLAVSPAGPQTRDWGQSVQYDITVKDASGAPVIGASVTGQDYLTLQSFQLTTTGTGTATRAVTVPNGTTNGTYNITFAASKTGYTQSVAQSRQIVVQHSAPLTLSMTVSPSGTQTRDWNQSVQYQIAVTDGSGAAVSGVTVSGYDALTRQNIQVAATNGQASYTVTVPSGLANGTYSVTFTASKAGYANSSQVTRQVDVNHTTTTTPTNLFTNGGFESGSSGWSLSGSAYVTNTFGNPRTGTGYAYLGANSSGTQVDNAAGVLHQAATIPSTATSATLRFWVSISTSESPTGGAYDFLTVTVVNSAGVVLRTLTRFSNSDAGAYRQFTADLSQYKGQSIRLIFSMSSDQNLPTVFRVDDVTLSTP